jgi:hypothetical protein
LGRIGADIQDRFFPLKRGGNWIDSNPRWKTWHGRPVASWGMSFLYKILRRVSLLIAAGVACARAAPLPTDFDLKAVFLFHFTQFVDWPERAFSAPDAPFVIGIVGADPFGPALSNIVRGEMVGRHPLVVRYVKNPEDESKCQILYISEASERLFHSRRLQNAPVLTVGESASFYEEGGMVQFFTDRRHVRLRIDLAEARSHSLAISAKLLRVAEVTK